MSVWASLGGARLHRVELQLFVREVHTFADNNASGREGGALGKGDAGASRYPIEVSGSPSEQRSRLTNRSAQLGGNTVYRPSRSLQCRRRRVRHGPIRPIRPAIPPSAKATPGPKISARTRRRCVGSKFYKNKSVCKLGCAKPLGAAHRATPWLCPLRSPIAPLADVGLWPCAHQRA
jgi:hypothetical protein